MTGSQTAAVDQAELRNLLSSTLDRVDALEAELRRLRGAPTELLRSSDRDRTPPRPRARRIAVIGATAAAMIAAMGVAAASTPGHPADVTFVPLSVPKKVISAASVGKGGTATAVVVGGSTTVPTDATSVQLSVAVKSTTAGSLTVFPTDNPAGPTADTITFPGGSVLTTTVSKQSPGLSGKISVRNNGTAAAVVTVTITGYSTQVTASGISGSGGSAGQVLTNDGAGGAAWRTAVIGTGNLANGAVTAAKLSPTGSTSGQVLVSTGGAVTWATPVVPGYQIVSSALVLNPANSQSNGSVQCPQGKVALGGGVVTTSPTVGAQTVASSFPLPTVAGWAAYVNNTSAANQAFAVYAVCGSGS